jgi:hypothetical protein
MSKVESRLQQRGWEQIFVKLSEQTEKLTQAELEHEKTLRVTAWQRIWLGAAIMGNEEAQRMLAQGPPS